MKAELYYSEIVEEILKEITPEDYEKVVKEMLLLINENYII